MFSIRCPKDWGYGSVDKEKGTDLRFDLEIDSMGTDDELDVGDEDVREIRDAPGFRLEQLCG